MDFWAITDQGRVRKQNQDTCAASCENKTALLLVCDGMGGAAAGDVASRLCVTIFSAEVKKELYPGIGGEKLCELMARAASTANEAVWKLSLSDKDCAGMGTTIVSAVVAESVATVLNVGDSRCYLVSGGTIRQITRDHSVVEDMIRRGEITRDESRVHPQRNLITRALGTAPEIVCDFFTERLAPGDLLLLCSDGLSNLFSEKELLEKLEGADSLERCCKEFIQQSLERGAPDNVTAVLYRE